jgi:ribonuclease HI
MHEHIQMSDSVERILAAIAALSQEERRELFERLAGDEGSAALQTALPLQFAADDLAGEVDYVIVFDGGSQGNPGPGFGSYALTRQQDGKSSLVRLDFGRVMTNNEAEYEALTAALQGLTERIEAAGQSANEFAVEVRGDSALVINQVKGTWKAKDDRMRLLRNQARELLRRFKGHRLMLQGREESVRVLGH